MKRSRWEGTFPSDTGIQGCANGKECSCVAANSSSSEYNDAYKLFLNAFFLAQVTNLELCIILNMSIRYRAGKFRGDGFIGRTLNHNSLD